jgi:hypothetical protein
MKQKEKKSKKIQTFVEERMAAHSFFKRYCMSVSNKTNIASSVPSLTRNFALNLQQ